MNREERLMDAVCFACDFLRRNSQSWVADRIEEIANIKRVGEHEQRAGTSETYPDVMEEEQQSVCSPTVDWGRNAQSRQA